MTSMAAATLTEDDDALAPSECFRVEHDDRFDLVELRQPVKKKLEAQYRRWQDHDQYLWQEAIKSSNTVDFLGLDRESTLQRLSKYVTSRPIPLAILSELRLCPIRPNVADFYELESEVDVNQWLYNEYRRYGILVLDLGETKQQYRIPLLDLTVVAGDESLLFNRRPLQDASSILPCSRKSCRLILFPQTRYSFIEDNVPRSAPLPNIPNFIQQIFQSLFPVHDEQFKIMSYNLLPHFRGTAGYYNSFASPFTERILQRSYAGPDITYLAALYPVINFEYLDEYENRKMSERETSSMQRHGSTGFPAIAQARYSRHFDFPEEIQLHTDDLHRGNPPEMLQSGRALYEFACGEVDTMALDKHQISVLENLERDSRPPPHILVVEPMWILAFPAEDLLCLFRNERGDIAIDDPFRDITNGKSKGWTWARLFIELIEKADNRMGQYEPTYRTWLAKLRIRVQTSRPIDQSLVKKLSDFVAEVTILLDPLQNQIRFLQDWRQFVEDNSAADKAVLEMYDRAIIVREAHLGLFQRLLDHGKNTQALASNS